MYTVLHYNTLKWLNEKSRLPFSQLGYQREQAVLWPGSLCQQYLACIVNLILSLPSKQKRIHCDFKSISYVFA